MGITIMKKIDPFFKRVRTYVRHHHQFDFVALAVSLVTFSVVTFINAPRASIWFDEAFSTYIAQFSFWDIARYTAVDVHPPLYYWLLKVWSMVFGTTPLAYRSLSIVLALAVIAAAFFFARRLFGRKVAWVSLLFLTLSPMLVRYADEARMYTMSALIVVGATQLLMKATQTKQRNYWVWYGVLVSLGMWTHYFTALAWLAHWVWWACMRRQKGDSFKVLWKKIFTKEWVTAYAVAVGLFLPWLVVMVRQLGIVQGGGFWIGPVGVDTVNNYFTNVFYYLEHAQVQSWQALALIVVVVTLIVTLPKAYRALTASEKRSFLLIASLAWVPPVLLFIVSLPPLRSSFVERYLVPSVVIFMIFMAVVFVAGTRRLKPVSRALPILLVAGMMIFGITNVYKYGNFNKNTSTHIMTGQVVQKIQAIADPGVPIVASSPWVFYEAVPYATDAHPVYFIDANTQYIYGSLEMLKDTDLHKIKDIDAFEQQHPIIWYLGMGDDLTVAPYKASWQALQTVGVRDDITGKVVYKATQYRVSAE